MAVVFLVASGSSIILQKTGVHEHITAIFIFAVFLTSILTDGYIYGIVSALVGTLAVNYAYTYPFYALDFRFQNIMLKCFKKINKKDTGVFAAGIKLLSSKDAKKLYTNCTAAVLRAQECVLKTATTIQENAEDIYAEAQQINEERAAKDAEEYTDVEDVEEAEETAEEASEENEAK